MDRSEIDDKTARLAEFLSSPVVKRSVMISGHATSVSLEQPFWDALTELAETENKSLNALIAEIDDTRSQMQGNLSSALRLYVIFHLTKNAPPPNPLSEVNDEYRN